MRKVHLICLPFSGGTKYSYSGFQPFLPQNVKLHTFDLPGRGKRVRENCLRDIHLMVEDLFPQIEPLLQEPYVLYGHSLGSLLAYLLCRKIIDKGYSRPLRLILSGHGGPSVKKEEPLMHTLGKEDFMDGLRKMGGMPEVLDSAELMDLFEPVLRADLEAAETYEHQIREPLNIPFTIMLGEQDDVSLEETMAWQKETLIPIDVRCFSGHHFFILNHTRKVVEIIVEQLGTLQENTIS